MRVDHVSGGQPGPPAGRQRSLVMVVVITALTLSGIATLVLLCRLL